MGVFISKSVEETASFAEELAKKSKGGDVFALYGNLGAGKTSFCKGFARGLGIKKAVNSPTFVVMKVYPNNNGIGLAHIDAYRLSSGDELLAIGAEEYFNDGKHVTIIEWPENVENILPKRTKKISIGNADDENFRKISF